MFTWLDIELVFEKRRAEDGFPTWLLRYTVYQDDVDIEVLTGTSRKDVDIFLSEIFGARYFNGAIALESTPDTPRSIAVHVEESEGLRTSPGGPPNVPPSFRRIAVLPDSGGNLKGPDSLPEDSPQIIAFYSFKGGVGRTTHLLAYLQALLSAKEKRSVLVIDADLEAPGLTTLVGHDRSIPAASFSFIDLLALAQSDRSTDWCESLRVATHFTRRQVLVAPTETQEASAYIIPAFRSEEQAMRLDIRPEHFIDRPDHAWSLPLFLTALAKSLDVDLVLLDLRAGYSELSSPFLFDPRVKKMLVTTPSSQSIDGTVSILQQLSKVARTARGEGSTDPTVILSFVLPELINSELVRGASNRLLANYPASDSDETLSGLQLVTTLFSQELLYLESLKGALERLAPSQLVRTMADMVEFDLPPKEPANIPTEEPIDNIRRQLKNLAADVEYAESGKGEKFLRIAPLRALARQYTSAPPVAVVIGAKGSGKTYTYLQILRGGQWSSFVHEVIGEENPDKTPLWPILYSQNLAAKAQEIVNETRTKTQTDLSIGSYLSSVAVSDRIRKALAQPNTDETWWRHTWFQILAASIGFPDEPFNTAAGMMIDSLRKTERQLVFMIDGLEDLLPEIPNNRTQQLALRSLIQGVPGYLREVPDCPLGVLIFVRADLARAAIPQNYGQFSKLYEAYALQWNEEEALRLAVWLSDSAGVRRPVDLRDTRPENLSREEAKEALLPVWGRKLGTERSREARSAEWVIAALSDFNGQIQARDLVRFFHYAADGSIQSAAHDRVLNPTAIRNAIKPCSERKIEETVQEIPKLNTIFSKLRELHDLRIPFDAAEANMTLEEIQFLQSVGVVAELEGRYYVPEIFRFGLGLRLSEGARPRVLSFARKSI